MKKQLSIISLLLLLLMLLSGCGGSFPEAPSTVAFEDLPTPTPTPTPLPIPDHIQQMYDRVEGLLSSGGFPFTMDTDKENPIYCERYELGCSFIILEGTENPVAHIFQFFASGDRLLNTFLIYVDFDTKPEISENLITLVLMATNPSLSIKDAADLMREMVSLYLNEGETRVVDNGDYWVYIGTSDLHYIKAMHKDEILPFSEKQRPWYTPVVYDVAIEGKTNVGTTCSLAGSVESVQQTRSISGIEYTVAFRNELDGQTYYLHYLFDLAPIILKPGDQYKVYGLILNNSDTPNEPHIKIMHLEEL